MPNDGSEASAVAQMSPNGGEISVDPFRRTVTVNSELCRAFWAFINDKIAQTANVLHDGCLAIAIASCAKPMRWLGAASLWLQHIGECAPSDGLKLVFLLLSIPFFKVSHLLFKIAYAFNQIRLRRLCGEDFF